MNNNLLLLLPLLMNGKSNNLNGVIGELIKNQQSSINPMTLLMLSMLGGKESKNGKEGTDAVKDFGGEDVVNALRMLLQKDQSS